MNTRERHQERRPRDLQDISHLYLSSGSAVADAAPPRAVVCLACAGSGPWRAFAAAGLARAFEAAGLDVTLLETGRALPNAGFYFALEPSAYLRPVLDPRAIVSGRPAGSLRFAYARDPSRLLPPSRGEGLPGRARIVLFAFDRSVPAPLEGLPPFVGELFPAATVPVSAGAPRRAALVTAGPDDAGGWLARLRRRFEDAFPGAPVLDLPLDGDEGTARRSNGGYGEGIARRSPPVLDLFGGAASSLLQRLAHGREDPR